MFHFETLKILSSFVIVLLSTKYIFMGSYTEILQIEMWINDQMTESVLKLLCLL